jgi:quercetin dioxygenase-like cupin family protein
MKRLIPVLVVAAAAAVWVAVALATPGSGQSNKILSIGSLQTDELAFNTGLSANATGIKWGSTDYTADQLPEFLMKLRSAGVTNLGEWLNLHPLVSAKFGMLPVGLLKEPEVVTQQATFNPGATSGWHTHPGYLTATVVSGEVTRYATDCSSQTFDAGQSFYETGAKTFVVKNQSTSTPAVVMVTFVVPGGTPTTGLRIDEQQPSSCGQ